MTGLRRWPGVGRDAELRGDAEEAQKRREVSFDVYRTGLTDRGNELEPLLDALGDWGSAESRRASSSLTVA